MRRTCVWIAANHFDAQRIGAFLQLGLAQVDRPGGDNRIFVESVDGLAELGAVDIELDDAVVPGAREIDNHVILALGRRGQLQVCPVPCLDPLGEELAPVAPGPAGPEERRHLLRRDGNVAAGAQDFHALPLNGAWYLERPDLGMISLGQRLQVGGGQAQRE